MTPATESDMKDVPVPGELAPQTSNDAGTSTALGPADDTRLKKTLKDRHLSMIALGGALGTGLLIGT